MIMKTNYKTENFNKALRTFFLSTFLVFSTVFGIMAQSVVVTTVFEDDFDRADVTPGGTPEVTYTVTATGTAIPIIESNRLRLPNVSGENARTQVMASISAYSSPFNPKLESIDADSVVWALNMRQNYKGRLTGIDNAASRGIATVLVASSTDLSTANGYAIVNGGAAPINYRLVKFSNGLTTADNITVIQEGQTLPDNREFMSIKVVFIPSTKTWKLYDRIDGPASGGTFADPLDETTSYTLAGAVVDDTHTNTSMSAFGFTHKYSASTSFVFWIDNFSVNTYEIATGINTNQTGNLFKWTYTPEGISVQAKSALVSLFDITGSVVQSLAINEQGSIVVNRKGVYFLRIELPNNKISVEKILIQ